MKKNHRYPSSLENAKAATHPLGVTILIFMVLIFTLLNALRVSTAIRTWTFLIESPLDVPVIYLVITGAIWTGIGFSLVLGLLTRRKWSPNMMQVAVVLYVCYYWLDRLFIAELFAISSRWQFAMGSTILLICFTFWTLTRPKNKVFFIK